VYIKGSNKWEKLGQPTTYCLKLLKHDPKAFAMSICNTTYSRCMSKVTQIPCTMINEKINELKKCCKIEETKYLFINQYKTSPIVMCQMLLEGFAEIESRIVPKI
jgi:predicted transcriptional regulator